MSQPPPYDANPDKRPLPAGWIEQYDKNYNAWFYVNTRENPPKSSWEHPLGPIPPPPAPPQAFSPPAGPPPPDNRGSPYPPGPQGPYPKAHTPSKDGVDRDLGKEGRQVLLVDGSSLLMAGSSRDGPGNRAEDGNRDLKIRGYYAQPQQPQVVYVKDKKDKDKKKHGGGGGMGMGTALAAGGAGILGGVLLADAIDDHNDYEYDQGFQDGMDAGGDDFF